MKFYIFNLLIASSYLTLGLLSPDQASELWWCYAILTFILAAINLITSRPVGEVKVSSETLGETFKRISILLAVLIVIQLGWGAINISLVSAKENSEQENSLRIKENRELIQSQKKIIDSQKILSDQMCIGLNQIVLAGKQLIISGKSDLDFYYKSGLLTEEAYKRAIKRTEDQISVWTSASCKHP